MLKVILGEKGTGKTKRLLDMTNDALKVEHGDIVFLDDDKRYMYDLRHEIRFVDITEFSDGFTAESFLAFISGMLASNFDISMISVDAYRKIVSTALESDETKKLFESLARLSETHKCSLVVSISEKPECVPQYIAQYA